MDTSITGSGSRTIPVGALLGDTKKLYELAKDSSPEARSKLSQKIGSILEADVTRRESELVADVLTKLMRQAEKELRHAIAEQVSKLDNVPLRLVLQLANDEIEIARPILTDSTVLSDFDLMYIIKSKTTEYWQAIASRDALSEQVIDTLAETKDFDTALTLAENNNITLTEYALVIMSDLAQGHDNLAMPLLRREEVTHDIAAQLFDYVGEEIKRFITTNYSLDIDLVNEIVEKSVEEFSEPEIPKGFVPDDYMINAAKSFKDKELLTVKLMLGTLRRGHMKSFIAQFATYTGLSYGTVGQILSQTNGQGLAIASRAFGIEKQDFISIFLLTTKIWNDGRSVETRDIKTAIEYFNKATPEMAREIIQGKENKVVSSKVE